MIFLTVGTDRGFNRLVRAMDTWANGHTQVDIFAQIGRTIFEPTRFPFARFLDSKEFSEKIKSCQLIVSHAGMGTMLTALNIGKPIIIFPRDPALGEVGNSHQLDTANAIGDKRLVFVARNEKELHATLARREELEAKTSISDMANDAFCKSFLRALNHLKRRKAISI